MWFLWLLIGVIVGHYVIPDIKKLVKKSERRMNRFLVLPRAGLLFASLVLFFSLLSSALFHISSANATSIYDDTIQSTETVKIKSGSTELDLTTGYVDFMNTYCSNTARVNDFLDIVTGEIDGNWVIWQSVDSISTGSLAINIIYSDSPTAEITFSNAYSPDTIAQASDLESGTIYGFHQLRYYPSTTPSCYSASSGDNIIATTWLGSISGTRQAMPYVNTFPVDYPEGYEGEEIPTNGLPDEIVTPDVAYLVDNYELQATYLDLRTFL